tara:strand:- start:658 stop:1317 length:660 start_codon:yes stop_codon:yes gene_type:complete
MSTDQFFGFTDRTLVFLKQLKANNNRDWFTKTRKTYEKAYKEPALEFAAAMADQLQSLTGLAHTSKLFRIHRDVRFAKDKTPYNTHLHLSFTPDHAMANPPCWFFGLDTERLTLGTGIFAFDAEQLAGFRSTVAGPKGPKILATLKKLTDAGARIGAPELKRVPSGYARDHPQEALLRRKGLAIWSDIGEATAALDENLVATCGAEFRRLKPVFDVLLA